MLLHAEWVVPVCAPPIRDGAVRIHSDKIVDFGTLDELTEVGDADKVVRHDGCILMPGLVNAHTHLSLTALAGLIGPMAFPDWIARTAHAMRSLDEDDLTSSAEEGARLAVLSGTTAVGDIAYGPESPSIAADAGLGGTFFWEVLGMPAAQLDRALEATEYPVDSRHHSARRTRYGISPHAPYTSGPELIRAAHHRAMSDGAAFAIHLAESPAELELLERGTGPLAAVAERTADGFVAPGTTPVRYLADLGVLSDALLIHCAHLKASEIPRLAAMVAGVALCPRSNEYLGVGPAPVGQLRRSGVTLGIGTDSMASNSDLDLFAEARALRAIAPTLGAQRIVEMMTAEGARALGLSAAFGTLAPDTQADIAIFELEGGDDPYEALVSNAGGDRVRGVIAGGVWRVRAGQPTFGDASHRSGYKRAADKAAAALEDLL